MSYPIETIGQLLEHSGLVYDVELRRPGGRERFLLNGAPIRRDAPLPHPGDVVTIRGFGYRVVAGGGHGRLQLEALEEEEPRSIGGPVRAHCGYHKALTMYSRRVYERACRPLRLPGKPFRHFFHRADAFYRECERHGVASVSGHALDLDRFADVRVVRFVRDPRDLVVSGYFYHRRGAEHWTNLIGPTDLDWMMVGGAVPGAVPADTTFAQWLNSVPLEEGLLSELDFRSRHFASMAAWPVDDERVLTFRYEEIVGNEVATFRSALAHLQIPRLGRWAGLRRARRTRASRRAGKSEHIRNPASGQWRTYFTPRVRDRFNERYGSLLEGLGYGRE